MSEGSSFGPNLSRTEHVGVGPMVRWISLEGMLDQGIDRLAISLYNARSLLVLGTII